MRKSRANVQKFGSSSSKVLFQAKKALKKANNGFRFLELPGEVRNIIYRHVLVIDSITINPTQINSSLDIGRVRGSYALQRKYRKSMAINLLRACRQTHAEGTAILYMENCFEYKFQGSWLILEQWLNQIGKINVGYLNYIKFYWQSCNFLEAHTADLYAPFRFFRKSKYRAFQPEYQFDALRVMDREAFQRVCRRFDANHQLEVIYIAAWQENPQPGFNSISYYRASIVRAQKKKVDIKDLPVMNRSLVRQINRQEEPSDTSELPHRRCRRRRRPSLFAVQIDRYQCRADANHRAYDHREVAVYYIPSVTEPQTQ